MPPGRTQSPQDERRQPGPQDALAWAAKHASGDLRAPDVAKHLMGLHDQDKHARKQPGKPKARGRGFARDDTLSGAERAAFALVGAAAFGIGARYFRVGRVAVGKPLASASPHLGLARVGARSGVWAQAAENIDSIPAKYALTLRTALDEWTMTSWGMHNYVATGKIGTHRGRDAILGMMSEAPVHRTPLYRGLGVEPGDKLFGFTSEVNDEALASFTRKGAVFDLPPSSFTAAREQADVFAASGSLKERSQAIIFQVDGRKQSLDISSWSAMPEEAEHIMGGRFRVREVTPGPDGYVVRIEQIANLKLNVEEVLKALMEFIAKHAMGRHDQGDHDPTKGKATASVSIREALDWFDPVMRGPEQLRSYAGRYLTHKLAPSVAERGLDKPIVVLRGPGKPVIYDGHHRLVAALDAGMESVPVVFADTEQEADRLISGETGIRGREEYGKSLIEALAKHLVGLHNQKTHGRWAHDALRFQTEVLGQEVRWSDTTYANPSGTTMMSLLGNPDARHFRYRTSPRHQGMALLWNTETEDAVLLSRGKDGRPYLRKIGGGERLFRRGQLLRGRTQHARGQGEAIVREIDRLLPAKVKEQARAEVGRQVSGIQARRERRREEKGIYKAVQAVLAKHDGPGEHEGTKTPQSVHAGGRGTKVTSQMLRERLEEDGGYTYQPVKDTSPTEGFVVSVFPEAEVMTFGTPTLSNIMGFLTRHRQKFEEDERIHAGAWVETTQNGKPTGRTYLDMSIIMEDEEEAKRLGYESKQKAVWDLKNNRSIETGYQRGDVLKRVLVMLSKHGGPGEHKETKTPQSVHAGGSRRGPSPLSSRGGKILDVATSLEDIAGPGHFMLPVDIDDTGGLRDTLANATRELRAWWNVDGKDSGRERGYLIAPDGKVVLSTLGTTDATVMLDKGERVDPGHTFIHLHPAGTPLSGQDVRVASKYGINKVMAVGSNGLYAVTIRSNDPRKVSLAVDRADNSVKQRFWPKIRSGSMDVEEANDAHWHNVWRQAEEDDPDIIRYVHVTTPGTPRRQVIKRRRKVMRSKIGRDYYLDDTGMARSVAGDHPIAVDELDVYSDDKIIKRVSFIVRKHLKGDHDQQDHDPTKGRKIRPRQYPDDPGGDSPEAQRFARVIEVHGADDIEALFPGGTIKTPTPWPRAARRKQGTPYDRSIVQATLLEPPRLEEVDPRWLHAFQPHILRPGVVYYLGDEWRRTGETYAEQDNIGNRYPFVYEREDGQNIILAGHHRAAAALLRGQPLVARRVEGPWG